MPAPAATPQTRFDRYELKYVVPLATAQALLDRIEPYVRRDPYARAGGLYRVVSLYYDSPALSAFWEKLDGVSFRRKVRLRVYPDVDPELGFLEIKERLRHAVRKRRVAGSVPDLLDLMETGGRGREPGSLGEVEQEAVVLARQLDLRPTITTLYTREAWSGRFEHGVRVTVDRNLRRRRPLGGLDYDTSRDPLMLSPFQTVVEAKCDRVVPSWLAAAFASLDLTSRRFSKYCHAVDQDRHGGRFV